MTEKLLKPSWRGKYERNPWVFRYEFIEV